MNVMKSEEIKINNNKHYGVAARTFHDTYINIRDADSPALCVNSPSATMVLIVQYEMTSVFSVE